MTAANGCRVTNPNKFQNARKNYDRHDPHSVPVLRRPLRGGAGVLPQGSRRRGRDADALQRKPEPNAAWDTPGGIREEGYACRVPHPRFADPGVRRVRRYIEVRRVPTHTRPADGGGRSASVRRPRRRRQRPDAAGQNVLVAMFRHAHRSLRTGVDGHRQPGPGEVSEQMFDFLSILLVVVRPKSSRENVSTDEPTQFPNDGGTKMMRRVLACGLVLTLL